MNDDTDQKLGTRRGYYSSINSSIHSLSSSVPGPGLRTGDPEMQQVQPTDSQPHLHPLPWEKQTGVGTHAALACHCNAVHTRHTGPRSRCSTQEGLQVSSAQSLAPGGGEHAAPYLSGTGHWGFTGVWGRANTTILQKRKLSPREAQGLVQGTVSQGVKTPNTLAELQLLGGEAGSCTQLLSEAQMRPKGHLPYRAASAPQSPHALQAGHEHARWPWRKPLPSLGLSLPALR